MKEAILYLECASGISGDMTVAALLDLGANQDVLRKALASLPLQGYEIKIGRRKKQGLDACSFDVILDRSEQHHRHFSDISEIIEAGKLSESVKALAKKMFLIVAKAEAKAHGLPIEQVHFHEVGAVDSIVDLVAVAVCLESLGIKQVIVSPLREGSGTVKCMHGCLPVPVPAVLNIVVEASLSLQQSSVEGEMVTPTGAAIAAAIRNRDSLPKTYRVCKVGLGAGKRDYPHANILRAMLIEEPEQEKEEDIWVLETNMDDVTGEMLGFCMEELLKAGARDVSYHPIFMKKNRPAWMLQVICDKALLATLERVIFYHTTTIGIRRYPVLRSIAKRKQVSVETEYGTMFLKHCEVEGKSICYPEYESVRELSEKMSCSFQEAYSILKAVDRINNN